MTEMTARKRARNEEKRKKVEGHQPSTSTQFRIGNRAAVGHGRPVGAVEIKTKVRAVLGRELLEALARGDETLPGAFDRWASLLKSPDERIRLEAERFLHEVTNGRAAVSLQLAGPGGSGELVLRWQEARPGGEAAPPALPAAGGGPEAPGEPETPSPTGETGGAP